MQDASKNLGYMRRDICQICLFEPVDCGMSDISITWPANNVAMALSEAVTLS
jgi:hypothetical protein